MATVDGGVAFDAGGKPYVMRFTANALCLLEDKTESKMIDIGAEIDFGLSMTTLRAMFWAGCGEANMTLAQAGEMIDALGIGRARIIAVEAFNAALEQPSDGGEAGAGADRPPTVAAAG